MLDDDFEFWRDLKPRQDSNSNEQFIDYPIHPDPFAFPEYKPIAEEKKTVTEEFHYPKKIVAVPKTQVKREKRKSNTKTLNKRFKAFIVACFVVAGLASSPKMVEIVKPYATAVTVCIGDNATVSNLWEHFINNDGYLDRFEMVCSTSDDGRDLVIDFDNPANMWVSPQTGEKVGPAVSYYKKFDQYVSKNNGGVGYFEIVHRDNEQRQVLGLEPISAGPYSPEELDEMFTKNESNELTNGGNNGKRI